jgi:hypothetical protein
VIPEKKPNLEVAVPEEQSAHKPPFDQLRRGVTPGMGRNPGGQPIKTTTEIVQESINLAERIRLEKEASEKK